MLFNSPRSSISSNVVTPRLQFTEHKAAVKALDWCPYARHLLATGGGLDDETIKIWDSTNGNVLLSKPAPSQVTSLVWSRCHEHRNEFVTSHGGGELNLWRFEGPDRCMSKNSGSAIFSVYKWKKHRDRILNLVASPDGDRVASVSADETIMVWNVFGTSSQVKRPLMSQMLSSVNVPVIR